MSTPWRCAWPNCRETPALCLLDDQQTLCRTHADTLDRLQRAFDQATVALGRPGVTLRLMSAAGLPAEARKEIQG